MATAYATPRQVVLEEIGSAFSSATFSRHV
jgi:hypothetical protein